MVPGIEPKPCIWKLTHQLSSQCSFFFYTLSQTLYLISGDYYWSRDSPFHWFCFLGRSQCVNIYRTGELTSATTELKNHFRQIWYPQRQRVSLATKKLLTKKILLPHELTEESTKHSFCRSIVILYQLFKKIELGRVWNMLELIFF